MDPIRESARHIRPNPIDPSILYLQPRHRALWQGHRATPFSIGETMITLEDVAIQLGLPIDGKEELIGKTPGKPGLRDQRLRISWLKENIPLDDGPEGDVLNEELHQIVRAYIFRRLGGFFMPDTSENMVSHICLPLLRNLEEAGRYSWGSTVLAYLFHEICEATMWDDVGLREHGFPSLASRLTARKPRLMSVEDEATQYPVPAALSARYVADKVMWQYGMRQDIPEKLAYLDLQHTLKLTNKMIVHWPNRQLPWVQMCEQHWNRLVDALKTTVLLASHSCYMRWYKEITRKWVHPVEQGETYGVIADRVYKQPIPADEIAHICRHMQSLNVIWTQRVLETTSQLGRPYFCTVRSMVVILRGPSPRR
ncbi:serine/threonine-protein phosphatase 7 long form-like protein [Senna tora]|uniref:Serine/threonine-protein phosphatase 7 long form-like protein n=1 Tax=Senna tora TaxID=362788 RepID=A0A835CLA3_9FABA|nr:serine/threonine-protein phosphatase 7 long form-like protein [Senna tora]